MSRLPTRALATTLAAVLAGGVLAVVTASAPMAARTLGVQQVPVDHGTRVPAVPRPDDLSQGAGTRRTAPVVWPTGSAEVDLTGRASLARAGALPVWLGRAPSGPELTRVGVTVRDRSALPEAWRNGLVVQLTPTDAAAGPATVALDYAGFAGAFGADWTSRLRVTQVPACGLTTPDATGCAPTLVPSKNDVTGGRVTAQVSLVGGGATTLALTAGGSGGSGDFTASTLQASGTWSAGTNSGSFSWDYPLRTPPSLGGPAPKVSLAYSSAAVDGRSQVTNNQPSWVGEGFEWWPGYIERQYKPCADDTGGTGNNATETGDECWGTDNANMSLNGGGGELIRDDATGVWRLKNDDNSTVERLTNTANGDNDNEYWRLTTSDGTQYYFGLNRLPGYTGTAPADKVTNSTWTEPVAGNNPGEPCHATTFITSFCTQAWRWNLDYVVDPHGNTMSLYYSTETNNYGRNNTPTDAVSYVRGGWLDHIDYGTDNRSGTDTENTATAAPMRVAFAAADRCLSACATHDATHWPDTPWDQECAGTNCGTLNAPTFWTTKRLGSVTTKLWNPATSAYRDVDTWTLTHTFPNPGDGTRAGLWLESIVHSGVATGPAIIGGPITMPEVNFDFVQMPNRVDTTTDGKFPMNWMRLSTIWTETGGKIDIRYSGPDCVPGTRMPSSPQTNTLLCYPVLEENPDHTISTEYFHKYVVTSVTEADRTGGSPDITTSYTYVGTPAWRHTDDDGLTKAILRTWSDYRGYSQVDARVGTPGSGTETLSRTFFFRGMDGDLDGSGGTRSVTLPAIDGNLDGDTADVADAPAVADLDAFSGMERQRIAYVGVETAPLSMSLTEPWQSAPKATRVTGQTTVYARLATARVTWNASAVSSGPWRVTRADSTFDSYGMPSQVDDQGDVAVTGDEQCMRTTYNRNAAANLVATVGLVEIDALRCDQNPTSDADVVSETRTSFDGQAYGVAPTKGDPTTVEIAKAWSAAGGPVWLTQNTRGFDPYGRPADLGDVRGNHTTFVYTPASGGPVTATAATNPLGTTTTTQEPAWGTATALVDNNNKRTEATFDALGRTRQVWLANHTKAAFPTAPNTTYSYLVRNSGGVNAITTAQLNAASTSTNAYYTTTYALYDGLLRARQTQTASKATGNVGTVFSETKYDDQGRTISQSQHFDNTVQPSTDLFTIADWQPRTQTVTVYDRAGRPVDSIFRSVGTTMWHTVTAYNGDRVNVTPPNGGTATTTIVDAKGHTVELRQYHDPAQVGSDVRAAYDVTTYHFDKKGRQDSATDDAGNAWTYTYDLLGRQTAYHNPDKGDATFVFNDVGDAVSTTDARGQTLAFTYDSLGRHTGEYAGSVDPANKLATWAWDPPGFKGQLASSSRWLSGGTVEYKTKIRSYTPLYQSTGEDYIIPAALLGLSGTYTVSRTYRPDGSPDGITYPAAGGLSAETVNTTYDQATGLPEQLLTNTGVGQYVSNTDYTAYGEMAFMQFQMVSGSWLQRSFTYDDATHRMTNATTIRQTSPQAVDNTSYGYDATGNVTSVADSSAGAATDTQCFAYDYARRLTEAWTPGSGDCGAARSVAALGGPAPYWQSWTFDSLGDRRTQTTHAAAGDTTTTYGYPAPGAAQPHAVATATTGTTVQRYQYDQAGNTTCRPSTTAGNPCPPGAGSQTLAWDAEGRLGSVDDTAGTSRYTFTPDGDRLVGDDPTTTTLYLPGFELKRDKATGTVTPTRYFEFQAQQVAMKTTGGAVTWLVADYEGSQSVAVTAGSQAISVRRQTPYGGARGTVPAWPTSKGFVGGYADVTGLTHVGARDYDPGLGRFVTVDPVFDQADPQSWNPYAYSANNPTTYSDPSGREHDEEACAEVCRDNGGHVPDFMKDNHGEEFANITDQDEWDGNYTRQHNAARDIAAYWIAKGPFTVFTEFPIKGASKKKNGNLGYADIVAYDEATNTYYIWEVKHICGDDGRCGAEGRGPSDLDWYMQKLQEQFPGATVKKGWALNRELMQPNPDNPRETLITNSSTSIGRDSPEFDGVIVYRTRKKRDTDDEDVRATDKREAEAQAKAQADAHNTDERSVPRKLWDWLVERHTQPVQPFGVPPIILVPLESPVGV